MMRKFWLPPTPGPSSAATRGSGSSRRSISSLNGMSVESEDIDDILVDALQEGISLPIAPNDGERTEDGPGESAKERPKANNITDEDFARSLWAEDTFEEFRRSVSSGEADRFLQRILEGQDAFRTELLIADVATSLRPLQFGDRASRDEREEEPEVQTVRTTGPSIPPPAFIIHDRPLRWTPISSEYVVPYLLSVFLSLIFALISLCLNTIRSGTRCSRNVIRTGCRSQRSSRSDQQPLCCICRCPIEGDVIRLECGSRYDMDCLKRMFEANVDDEYRFPPRCCGVVVPLTVVEDQLSRETRELYKAKIAEYSTPWRLYCSNAQCARFLGSRQHRATSTTCSDCHAQTCVLCTAPAHPSARKCKIDKGMRKALKLGQSNGWQRCPRCRQLVERNDGCYHMSCRCGAQFCYLCADNWGRCKCWQRRRAFVKILLFRWLHLRGNYLVNDEPAANTSGNAVTRLCRRSWKSVKKAVSPSTQSTTPPAAIGVTA